MLLFEIIDGSGYFCVWSYRIDNYSGRGCYYKVKLICCVNGLDVLVYFFKFVF